MKIYRFLLKFTGNDDEINLLGDGTEKPEFGKWAWMSPEQVVDLVGSTFTIGYLDLNTVIYPVILYFLPFICIFCAGSGVQEASLRGGFDSFLPSSSVKLVILLCSETKTSFSSSSVELIWRRECFLYLLYRELILRGQKSTGIGGLFCFGQIAYH